ncbi:MAG: TetR/AcrR family transcriptional regulator [Candidatus Omnitrophica bacterium]|nr:TetR/AcrR family transcriptional regulator [Candidatus Omnitrophota bacterium]
MEKKEYTLREKKFARTKIALMNEFIARMKASRFDDISIQEICKNVEVSDGTFFNYFPEKVDIVNYYRQLFFLNIVWKARKETPAGKYLALINCAFEKLAQGQDNLNIVHQILSIMLVQKGKPGTVNISDIEKHLAFPDCEGIEEMQIVFIDVFFEECLIGAVKNGELPENADIDDILISLLAIMGGTVLAAKLRNVKDRKYHYSRQLKLLWKGLGG